jgi:hypothetical protein
MSNGIIKMKGGGGTTYSDVTTTTSNLPEYAEPYFRDLLARTGYETSKDYVPYQGSRLADFSPMESEAMARFGELGMSGTSPEMDSAMGTSYNLSQNAGISSIGGSGYEAGGLNGAGNYDPTSRDSQYRAGSRNVAYQPGSYNTGYTANQMGDGSQYNAGQRDMGFEAGSINDPDMLKSYQNPYFQNVVDIQKREATRDADKRQADTGLSAAGSGSLGGYREAVVRGETERNLSQQLGDIQAQGSQAAYADAKAGFEADRGARAQQEQFAQSQFGLNEQGKQKMSELVQQGFSIEEAARQAQEEFGQAAFGMNEQAQQQRESFLQSQFGMDEESKQAAEQFKQSQFGLNSANGQFDAEMGMKQYSAYESAKQQAAQLGLTAAEMEQAGQIAAAKIQMEGSSQLAGQVDSRQIMEMERLKAMQNAGQMDRGMYQTSLDQGYQDFQNQQNWSRDQLAFYNNMLQGLPNAQGSTTTSPNGNASMGQQLMGLGIAGAGLYNAKNGGG